MSDDNVLDQNEIERLLSGGGPSSPTPPPDPPAAAASSGNDDLLNQSDLEALFGSLGGGSPAPAPAAPVAANENAMLGQNEIENLLKGIPAATAAPASPTPSPAPPKPAAPPSQPAAATVSPSPTPANPTATTGKMTLGGFAVPTTVSADEEGVPQGDIDYLLRRAEEALESISTNKLDLPTEVVEFQFPEFGGSVPNVEHATLDQISEVELDVKIELGRTNMYLEDVLKLRKGSVVPLDKMAGDAVDVYVNGRLLARGEVLVMNENFCVRVAELLAGAIPME